MGGAKRQNRASSTIRNPPSQAASVLSAGAPPLARVTLPSDLPGSLKYLDDAQLRRLLKAVTVEIVAIKAMPRRKALPLRWLGLQRKTNLSRFPIKRPERSTRYRKEKQISS